MKIAFVGKGGSGKTTLSSLVARHLVGQGRAVLALDADINQHLAVALGLDEHLAASIPTLGDHLDLIKDYLRGDNPRIPSAREMVKTTPPGHGSRLLTVTGPSPIHERLSVDANGVRLMVTGAFTEEDLGVACYHSKVGAVELLLNHLIDGPDEHVVVDMTAGADAFASGLFTRFDRTFLVAEPTRKGVAVHEQYRRYAADHGIPISVIGNKIHDERDVAFLRDHVGDDLLVHLEQSAAVRAQEQGSPAGAVALEAANVAALDCIVAAIEGTKRDWDRLHRQMIEFHVKNARSWANDAVGTDLSCQIDPDFRLDARAVLTAAV
ncbi:CO dehydrogenase maturation factor [Parafrankia irregularis]|uniref:CO dehydrogenase maturation factor n=1 Tax=Parafrankia irregularis TaxID=795642 RepID=A0A0S4QXU8_9ACTN|nr:MULTISPECIES: ATP-binding protein [Parafrankia]MBE3201561.1 ATP-binding protein [Parafrankia sp. CH37]CUU59366.1 CO dehydrogenase maturation factor [Parafrankia irregularis]